MHIANNENHFTKNNPQSCVFCNKRKPNNDCSFWVESNKTDKRIRLLRCKVCHRAHIVRFIIVLLICSVLLYFFFRRVGIEKYWIFMMDTLPDQYILPYVKLFLGESGFYLLTLICIFFTLFGFSIVTPIFIYLLISATLGNVIFKNTKSLSDTKEKYKNARIVNKDDFIYQQEMSSNKVMSIKIDVCWFCKKTSGNINTSFKAKVILCLKGQPDHTLSSKIVPRCKECAEIHSKAFLPVFLITIFLGPLILYLSGLLANSTNSILNQTDEAELYWLFLQFIIFISTAIILYSGFHFFEKLFVDKYSSKNILPESSYINFPELEI